MKFTSRWEMPEVTFYQVEGLNTHESETFYAYGKPGDMNDRGEPRVGELYPALDRALVAWVGEKYTGPRGAGGTGVGTAADWFFRMIGADELVEVDHATGARELSRIMTDVMDNSNRVPRYQRTSAIQDALERRGLKLAAMNHGR